jgi:hypothetical protein
MRRAILPAGGYGSFSYNPELSPALAAGLKCMVQAADDISSAQLVGYAQSVVGEIIPFQAGSHARENPAVPARRMTLAG